MFRIKVRLCELDLTQEWLLKELHKRGFDMVKGTLSKALRSKSPTDTQYRILEEANRIVLEQELKARGTV